MNMDQRWIMDHGWLHGLEHELWLKRNKVWNGHGLYGIYLWTWIYGFKDDGMISWLWSTGWPKSQHLTKSQFMKKYDVIL